MQTTYLKESLMFDRAAAECNAIIGEVMKRRTKADDEARASGDEPSKHYDIIIDNLRALQHKYQCQADEMFEMHKRVHAEIDEDGLENLMCAIAKSWADDYEFALSNNDESDINRLRREAKLVSSAYLTIDLSDGIMNRIERAQEKFKKIAHAKVYQIVEDTKGAVKYKSANGTTHYNGSWMRNRCPLCGGGMYYKPMSKEAVQIKCTGCSLHEVVKLRQ